MAINGLSAGLDSSVLKLILGFSAGQFAAPAGCYISLHSAILGTAKVIASEWTNGGAANTNYTSRLTAGTSGTGIGASNWSVAAFVSGTGCVATNSTQVAFFGAGLTGTGNTLASVGFNDSATIGGGNLDWFADLTSSQTIATGIIVQFNVGDIQLTLL